MENYDVNRDKFLDLMAKHHLDAGVNVVRLWNKAQEGDDIRPLAREFIADRLGQCLAAWECAAGAWRNNESGRPEPDPGRWDWDQFMEYLGKILEEDIVY